MSKNTASTIVKTISEKAAEKHSLRSELLSLETADSEYQRLLSVQAKQKAKRNASAKVAGLVASARAVAGLSVSDRSALVDHEVFRALAKAAAKSAVKASQATETPETETETEHAPTESVALS